MELHLHFAEFLPQFSLVDACMLTVYARLLCMHESACHSAENFISKRGRVAQED